MISVRRYGASLSLLEGSNDRDQTFLDDLLPHHARSAIWGGAYLVRCADLERVAEAARDAGITIELPWDHF